MRRVLLSAPGWLLVVTGLVLFPLPGPGLLVLAAGLALLARHDPWAARRVGHLNGRAVAGTRRSVDTWPRFALTAGTTLALGASGLVWLADPSAPGWWVLPGWAWLPGGTWAGAGQLFSGLLALGVVVGARGSVMRTAPVPERSGPG